MKKLTNRDLKVLTLLSIVVPISLLISFRLTGILPEPIPAKTVTIENVYWNMTRPNDSEDIVERVENSFADNETTINFCIDIFAYYDNSLTPPRGGNDVVTLGISANAKVQDGFVYSMIIRFSKTDNQSVLFVYTVDEAYYKLINLREGTVRKWSTNETEAYWETFGVGQPRISSMNTILDWIFIDENTLSHMIATTLEVTYFTSGAYRKVLIPITLGVLKS